MKKKSLYFAIILLLIVNIFLFNKISNIESNFNNNISQLTNSQNNLNTRIEAIYNNVDEMLKKEASILDDYRVEFGDLKSSDLSLPVMVDLSLKEFREDTEVSLQFNDTIISMDRKDNSFSATSQVYVFDDLDLKVIIKNGDTTKQESIEDYYYLKDMYLLEVFGGFSGSSSKNQADEFQYDGEIQLDFKASLDNKPVSIRIIEELNGEIINEKPLDLIMDSPMKINGKAKLEPNDKLYIYTIIEDNYQLNYKHLLFEVETDSDNDIMTDYFYNNSLIEIRDKDGQLLYKE